MQIQTPTSGRGYFDRRFNAWVINVPPGGQAIASAEGELLSTVLGSCVAACLRDPVTGIGGMNHFLLPGEELSDAATTDDMRFGVASMEQLINALIKQGAMRSRLQAKLFGGATMMAARTDGSVGGRNARFALRFLACEGIAVAAQDLGGDTPRRANFEPATGRAWVNRLPSPTARDIAATENDYRKSIMQRDRAGDLEVF
jgi:chemotaxis protein CheD